MANKEIEIFQHVPKTYLAPIKSQKGLFEARIKLGSIIWRFFAFLIKQSG